MSLLGAWWWWRRRPDPTIRALKQENAALHKAKMIKDLEAENARLREELGRHE